MSGLEGRGISRTACAVDDAGKAEAIARALIAVREGEDYAADVGYRLNVRERQRYWDISDEFTELPEFHDPATGEVMVTVRGGGKEVTFRVEKCSGAISNYSVHVWR